MDLLSKKVNRFCFLLILFSLSVSLAIFTDPDDNRNYMLIGLMYLSPAVLLFSKPVALNIDIPLIGLLLSIFSTQMLFNPEAFRPSSFLFTCMFAMYFMAALRFFKRADFGYKLFLKYVRWIIYAYAIVLILQQIGVLLGLPIINQVFEFKDNWKLNSLSAEPSHSVRYIAILFYSYLILDQRRRNEKLSLTRSFRNNRLVWLAALYTLILSMSGTGIILIGVLLCMFVSRKNIVVYGSFIALMLTIGVASEFEPLQRSSTFLLSVVTGDPNAMIEADSSAAVRVAPWVYCIKEIDLTSLSGWFGHGMDESNKLVYRFMKYVGPDLGTGGIAALAYNNGILVALYYLIFSFYCCYDKKNAVPTIGLWVLCIMFNGMNLQMGWLCMLMLYIDKTYRATAGIKSRPSRLQIINNKYGAQI